MTTTSTQQRDARILERWLAGESGAAIARGLGLTRQGVGYVISRDATPQDHQARDRAILEREARSAPAAAQDPDIQEGRTCPVCGSPLPRGRRVTDGPECAKAWRSGGRFEDPAAAAEQRLRVARTTIKNRDRYDPAKVRWAEGVIERQGAPARAA